MKIFVLALIILASITITNCWEWGSCNSFLKNDSVPQTFELQNKITRFINNVKLFPYSSKTVTSDTLKVSKINNQCALIDVPFDWQNKTLGNFTFFCSEIFA